MSVTYSTAHGNARSLIHWAKPRIEPTSSWVLVGFVSAEPQRELPVAVFQGRSVKSPCDRDRGLPTIRWVSLELDRPLGHSDEIAEPHLHSLCIETEIYCFKLLISGVICYVMIANRTPHCLIVIRWLLYLEGLLFMLQKEKCERQRRKRLYFALFLTWIALFLSEFRTFPKIPLSRLWFIFWPEIIPYDHSWLENG